MRVFGRKIYLHSSRKPWVLALAALLSVFVVVNLASMAWKRVRPRLLGDPLAAYPRVFLWAWERPENLDFLDPRDLGVAVLVKTIVLRGQTVTVRPRLQPFKAPGETAVIAVVRIETARSEPLRLTPEQTSALAAEIAQLASAPTLCAIQIDFDAVTSERPFYRTLLQDLRRRLPPSVKLSITALASWCIYDDWISDLPVDEAVPMLFRMAIDRNSVVRYLASGNDFRPKICRFSLGVSTDEPLPRLPAGRRIYVFNPRPWSAQSAGDALRRVRRWQ